MLSKGETDEKVGCLEWFRYCKGRQGTTRRWYTFNELLRLGREAAGIGERAGREARRNGRVDPLNQLMEARAAVSLISVISMMMANLQCPYRPPSGG